MQRNVNPVDKNSPEYLTKQVAGGRYSLLLILIFTTVNLVLLLVDANTYFLFSASIPYFLTAFGMGMDMGMALGENTYTYTALAISAVILIVYLVCWFMGKKRPGWLVAALVLFIVDSLGLLYVTFALLENPAESIMDFLFHGWAIVELIQAVRCAGKLKKLAPQDAGQPVSHGNPELQ